MVFLSLDQVKYEHEKSVTEPGFYNRTYTHCRKAGTP